jgi:hypothetical protein
MQAYHLANHIMEHVRSSLFAGEPPLSLSIGAADSSEAETREGLFAREDGRALVARRHRRRQAVPTDMLAKQALPFEEISRPVEREGALEVVGRFMDGLEEGRAGSASGWAAGIGQNLYAREGDRLKAI